MTIRLVWTPLARRDLKAIYIDIGKDQPAAAERYFNRIREKIERLRDQPRLGERRPEIFRTARMLVEHPYVVLCETFADADGDAVHTIEVVRILDGRRDLKALFRSP